MIHVAPKPEPKPPKFDFNGKVRKPGKALLKKLRAVTGATPKGSPKITSAMLKNYWTRALPTLAEIYDHVCAYCCVRIDEETGSRTVDHWKPKEKHPDLAYEWDNFRFAALRMNSRKGVHETLCDPFLVKDDWFVLNLITFALAPSPNLPKPLHAQVQHTIKTLQLDREPMRKRREKAWKLFDDDPSPYNWWLMTQDCPLVAKQYVAQRGAHPAAALPLYTPP